MLAPFAELVRQASPTKCGSSTHSGCLANEWRAAGIACRAVYPAAALCETATARIKFNSAIILPDRYRYGFRHTPLGEVNENGFRQRAHASRSAAQASNRKNQMAENDSVPGYLDRAKELQATGMTRGVAVNTALLEERIARWPSEWGNELHIQIYGDFEPPPSSLHFPELGITIEPDVVKSSPIITATCIVNARVTVSEKSIKGIVDASSRIDILLGLLAAIDWGNAGNGWWCHLPHEPMGGGSAAIEQSVLEKAIKVCDKLDPRVKRKVASALYWMREPRRMTLESYSNDVLRAYAGYWNAFECLVEALSIARPRRRTTKEEKQAKIDKFLADHESRLTPADVVKLNRLVDPGFRGKASYALRECFPDEADRYVYECFEAKPDNDRLYQIRNEINHGDIDASNPKELIRVQDKQLRLWMIVFGMLGQIIPVPTPVDTGAQR
jgi:hypothetical protein